MLGKPVIRGTRIPVELILRKLSEGANERDLLDAYPNLKATPLLDSRLLPLTSVNAASMSHRQPACVHLNG